MNCCEAAKEVLEDKQVTIALREPGKRCRHGSTFIYRCSAWSIALIALLLAGCCTRPRSPFVGLSPQESRALAQQLALRRDQELQADLRSAFASRSPKNILILSGGDAHGAFGCGILNGWRNAPNGRPKFDVVTGVSTGGLIATFAFLGEEQDDRTLREVYTNIRDKDIFNGPFNSFSSVFDTKPLKRLIARRVTPQTLCRVAAAHREGRRLYVTTVELESGAACIWPLSKIAFDAVRPSSGSNSTCQVNPAGLERFREILLATASIPVFFPPVEIDNGLHFDAGLREAVSLRLFMLGLQRAAEAGSLKTADQNPANKLIADPDGLPPTVWAILNGKLRSPPTAVEDNLLSIGVRSLEVYNETVVILSLRDAAHIAATHNPPFQFRWLSEPDELDAGPGPDLFHPLFDPAVTKRLYAAGEPLGQSGPSAWNLGPPPLDADPQ
jgi:predicted patatin/cPLA2 family phospholipase